MNMKKFTALGIVVLAALLGYCQQHIKDQSPQSTDSTLGQAGRGTDSSDNAAIDLAIEQQRSHVQLQMQGSVSKVLQDDNDGSRHQRFLVALPSGRTILVAHNIDLAGRVSDLQAGDSVELYGEYVWNERGGVMHWTHRDPAGRHVPGWIKHNGHVYQ